MTKKFRGLAKFGEALAEILGEWTVEVDKAIANGVDEGAEIFLRKVKEVSPVDDEGAAKSPYGYYKDNWMIKQETTSKFHRYVGNAKTVPSRKHGDIPLINILEYSTDARHNPKSRHVNSAIKATKEPIRNVFIKHLERGN